jgi:hypothetical protein
MNTIIYINFEKFNQYQKIRQALKATTPEFEETKYELYINEIKKQFILNNNELDFKSNNIYTVVTENITYDVGNQILNIINKEFNNIFINNILYIKNICNLNDSIGKPKLYNYEILNEIAPTNLRYIYHSFLILMHMKEKNLNNVSIIEIGGGYGGLSLFIIKLSTLFNINIKSYTIYDLPEVCKLVNKYSNILNLNVNTANVNDNISHETSFLISNYAFSELPTNIKQLYINNIFKYINHGLLIWNYVPFDIKYLEEIKIENNIEIDSEIFSNEDLIIKF